MRSIIGSNAYIPIIDVPGASGGIYYSSSHVMKDSLAPRRHVSCIVGNQGT